MSSSHRRRGRLVRTGLALLLAMTCLVLAAAAIMPSAGAASFSVSLSGSTADVKVPAPGQNLLPCATGATGTRHMYAESSVPAGTLANVLTSARVNIDVGSDGAPAAFLQPTQSHVTLRNQRGAVRLALTAGSCASPTLEFDGTVVSGSGTWTVDPAYTTDAYRETTGSGTFTFSASFANGHDKPWTIDLAGTLVPLSPSFSATFVRSYWGRLGADYTGRVATVVYRVTNVGPGDAFRVRFLPPTVASGISLVEADPVDLDDLAAGEHVDVTVRYRFDVRQATTRGPLVVARQFDTTLNLTVQDALDTPADVALPVRVSAPSFPPPL